MMNKHYMISLQLVVINETQIILPRNFFVGDIDSFETSWRWPLLKKETENDHYVLRISKINVQNSTTRGLLGSMNEHLL